MAPYLVIGMGMGKPMGLGPGPGMQFTLVTTTFGQWLYSSQIMVEKFFEFYTSQNSQIMFDNHNICLLHALISICEYEY